MHQPPLKDIVTDIRGLEPFPIVVTRVMEIASRDDVVPNDLLDVMRTDLGITCKVLKVCNSAFYGLRREVASLRHAGNMLGVKALVSLVLTCGAADYFRKYGARSKRDRGQLWKRCLTHALASKLVATRHCRTDPELAYTAGLLQDVGQLVLGCYYDDGRVFVDAAIKAGDKRIDAERNVLGMSHAEAGARLLARWDMPRTLIDAVRFHHEPAHADVDPVLAATIHLAETVGVARLKGDDPEELTYEVDMDALKLTGLELIDFDSFDDELRQELRRTGEMLAA